MKINFSKKTITVIVIILIILLSIYLYNTYFSSKQISLPKIPSKSTSNNSITNIPIVSSSFPIRKGVQSNPYVKNLQTILNNNYGLTLDVDGTWGNETDDAIKSHFNISPNNTITENDYNNILSSEGSNIISSGGSSTSFSDWLTNLLG
jgi:hypothetical protein